MRSFQHVLAMSLLEGDGERAETVVGETVDGRTVTGD